MKSIIEWISLKDKKPKLVYNDYLVCLENGGIFIANYSRIGTERWLIVGIGEVHEFNFVKYYAEIPIIEVD